MILQDNTLARQEAAREAYNDYIQYLYVFGELEDSNGGNGDTTFETCIKIPHASRLDVEFSDNRKR